MMGAGLCWRLLFLVLTVCSAAPGWASDGEHTFEILHVQSNKCLTVENDGLSVRSCSQTNNSLWTWGSSHRLFSLGTQKCLGIDISKPQDPLKLVSCDSTLMLWWRCEGRIISGASGYGLNVKNGMVSVAMKTKDEWSQTGKSETICDIPYYVVYTTGGSSSGKPCDFPFVYKGKWYHDCIYDADEDQEWCVTSESFYDNVLVGNCLKPVRGCNGTWIQNSDLQQCYQWNTNSVLRWKEAYMSCQSQGADLLSISSPEELKYIIETEDLPDSIWIGLNRLESSGGWQWSDNSPLNFINWDEGISTFSLVDGTSCGKLNVNSGRYETFPCDAALPYVCKKGENQTRTDPVDYWHYSEIECTADWMPYNGFCYLSQEPKTWQEAELSCNKENGSLISLHSLADIELVVAKLHSENENIWSGFQSQSFPSFFKWSDGTEAHFTYWDQNEPLPKFNVTPNCMSFSGQTGRWHVRNCSEQFKSVCRKPGVLQNATNSDSGCPPDKNWRRHGEFCYLINTTEVSYEARCSLTVTNKFEQEFLNSLIRKQNNIKGKYFWSSLRDVNNTGDYYWETADGTKDLTYSNWNTHQPASAGGCVALATGESLGKWEVKDCKTFKASSICKIRIGTAKEEETPKPPPTICPDDWESGADQYCYKLFHIERLLKQRTWEEAEGFCEEFGAHLVSFSHTQDKDNLYLFLKSLLRTSNTRWIWLGLNKRNLGNWEWSDGRPISSVMLSDFQEEDYSLRDCAAFEINLPKPLYWMGLMDLILPKVNYTIRPFHCEARHDWVCQLPKGAPLKTPVWYEADWRKRMGAPNIIEDGEYWFISHPELSYKEAELYCASNGTELANIDSLNAMTSIQNIARQKRPKLQDFLQRWWVKSYDFRGPKQFMLFRMMVIKPTKCHTLPPLSSLSERIAPISCTEKLPFICRSQNLSLLELVPTKVINSSGSCPKKWELFGNKCFVKIPEENITYSDASNRCHEHGGTLPSISNQREQDFITSLSSGLQQKFWIGLRYSLNAYKNRWDDGSDVTYTNFHPILQGRYKQFAVDLSNPEKNQPCVFLLNNPKSTFVGTWDFTACSDQQYVSICQKPADMSHPNAQAPVPEEAEYKELKYKFIQKNMTWYEALSECNSKNMDLVSITDQYQLSFITITVIQVGQPMWIGLSSQDDGIHYRWHDKSLVTLNRWSNESKNEACTFVALDGTWKTESCDVQLPGAICYSPPEKPKNMTSTEHIDCPHEIRNAVWVPYRNSCYTVILRNNRWLPPGLKSACRSLHPDAYFLSIRDEDENAFVVNLFQPYTNLATWVWLALHYESNNNAFHWQDETFVRYSNWKEGRPDVKNNSFYAAMRLDGFWDMFSNPKDLELLFLKEHSIVACKIEKGSNTDYLLPMPTAIPFSNYTYFLLKKKLTWFEAVKECKRMDGNLASVHDEDQQLFLEQFVRHDGYPLWIGLWNNDGSSVEWSDTTEVNYATKYFEKKLALGNCIYLDTKGVWTMKNCSERLDGAICYKSASAVQSELVGEDELCPKTPGTGRWVRYKDSCYGFDLKIYNYSVYSNAEASKMCQTADPTAGLLTVNDEDENVFVSKYLNSDPYLTSRVWLGVNSTSTGQKSVWLDGSPVEYTNWRSSPNEQTGSCVILLSQTGKWSKVPCAPGHARVVCKAPLRSSGIGLAVAFAVSLILVLLIGSLAYLYRKKRPLFSSVRYQRAEDQMESMIDYS
ncbi:lymphocyte antigen 75 isoform X2 [Eleutherodactylus coqui]|uniref:lymphocyte antigen 75 isoform X2 n=1 Tax=Eleutherodactylus coqui TaxID=57060 RepID=UPI003462A704